ncbi:MAG: hypothetical protein LBU66_04115, partial [Treponema sp.]|nr:hypothetical protein [Treponema sp.]
MKKSFFGFITIVVMSMVLSIACDTPTDSGSANKDKKYRYPKRYQVVPGWTEKGNDTIAIEVTGNKSYRSTSDTASFKYLPVIYADREGGSNNYLIYLGRIDNVPITSGTAMYYDGRTPITVSRTASTAVEEMVLESVETAVSVTTVTTSIKQRQSGINFKIGFDFFGTGARAKITNTIQNSTMTGRSITDTSITTQTKIEKSSDIVGVTVGNNDEPVGRYRLTLFATTDVYLTVRLNEDNTGFFKDELPPIISVCARESSFTYQLDYDPNTTGDFGRLEEGEMLPIPDDFSALPLPPGTPQFVAVGISGRIAHSNDGINWEQLTLGTGNWNSIAFGNKKFVAVSNRTGSSASTYRSIAHSSDGIEWTHTHLPLSVSVDNSDRLTSWNAVTYAEDRDIWVAVGKRYYPAATPARTSGRMAYSTDGVKWITSEETATVNSNTNLFHDVAYGNDRWLAVGTSGRMRNSVNSTTWATQNSLGTVNWNGVIYGNSKFVVVGNSGRMAYSPDGLSWTQVTVGTTNWNGIFYKNDMFLAVGNTIGGYGKMAYSNDGIAWNEINVGTSNWLGVTYGNGLWVAVGGAPGNIGRMARSEDGINWTE